MCMEALTGLLLYVRISCLFSALMIRFVIAYRVRSRSSVVIKDLSLKKNQALNSKKYSDSSIELTRTCIRLLQPFIAVIGYFSHN